MEASPFQLTEQAIAFVDGVLEELNLPDVQAAIASSKQQPTVSPYRDVLPILTAVGSGGDAAQAVPLAAAWILYNQASNLLDDLQDRDHKPLVWNEWPPTRAGRTALDMLGAAKACLTRVDTDRKAHRDILRAYNNTLIVAMREQANPPTSPALSTYFQHVVGKSGIILATVAWSGVRVHTDDPQALDAMQQYGLSLGILVQILDDCRDLNNGQLISDLANNPYTLPVLYALSQGGPKRRALLACLKEQPMDPAVIDRICGILDDAGAFTYCVAMMKAYEQKALDALRPFPAEKVTPLGAYVSSFLESIGFATN